jgi:HEAT repeat protein
MEERNRPKGATMKTNHPMRWIAFLPLLLLIAWPAAGDDQPGKSPAGDPTMQQRLDKQRLEQEKNLKVLMARLDPLLTSPKREERLEAVKALGEVTGDPKLFASQAVPRLRKAMQDADKDVRDAAVAALGNQGNHAKDAVPDLLKAFKEPERFEQGKVLGALFRNLPHSVAMVPDVIAVLGDKKQPLKLRHQAARVLSDMGPEASPAVPVMLAILRDDSEETSVRGLSLRGLGMIGTELDTVLPVLISLLRPDQEPDFRPGAAQALGRIGPRAGMAIPKLIEMAEVTTPKEVAYRVRIKSSALDALSKITKDPKVAAPVAARILVDPGMSFGPKEPGAPWESKLRISAINLLKSLGPDALDFVPQLLEALKDGKGSAPASEIALALAAIGPEAVPAIVKVAADKQLSHSPGHPRVGAIHALELMGPAAKAAIPALEEIASDAEPNRSLRERASDALRRIRP